MPFARRFAALAALSTLAPASAAAQENFHSPRQHAAPPLSHLIPSLRAPTLTQTTAAEAPDALVSRGDGSYYHDRATWSARVDADGSIHISDKSSIQGTMLLVPPLIVFAGSFDITDMMMRWGGQDPYQYQKLQFMKRTFDRRVQMRAVYKERQMERALVWLPAYLRAVWGERAWSPALKRRVLFGLWDECAERGRSHTSDGGRRARRLIEHFVRKNLPPGSKHGYTVAELHLLNQARRSVATFAPYRVTAPPLDDTSVARIAALARRF